MLYHEPTATLFSGDSVIVGIPPLRFLTGLSLAVPGFSLDPEACHKAVRGFLKDLPRVDTLAAGHGPAVLRDAREKLLGLARGS
jgi:hypothetical protein